jgi:hypothetical protein
MSERTLPIWTASFGLLACLTCNAAMASDGFAVAKQVLPDGTVAVEVTLEGREVAVYRTQSVSKPVVWPLRSLSGKAMTRSFPVGPVIEGEAEDHIHHRSLWIGHGLVNGIDFWSEQTGHGQQQHIRFAELLAGKDEAVIATENDWRTAEGKRVLVDRRRYRISLDPMGIAIDCDFRLLASDGPVVFGDTKEGTFALRVPGALDVDRKQGGRILNEQGLTDAAAWGRPSPWVDYSGMIDGQPAGLTVMLHPSVAMEDTRWHVRTYGLFAHNPFGRHEFDGEPQATAGSRIESGQSLVLHYRVLLHEGAVTTEQLAGAFARYAASSVSTP